VSRLALVTGGSRGIGYSIAEGLLRQGRRVVITGRSVEALNEATARLSPLGEIRGIVLDATDSDRALEVCSAEPFDILVCNVGMGYSGSVITTSGEDWRRVLDTNVTSAFDAIGAVLPGMLERSWGRIVTIGSMGSHRPLRLGVAYAASKHALLGLTRSIAEDTRGTGVTVNMVAPAFVRTEMMAETAALIAAGGGMSQEEAERRLGNLSNLGRLIEPEEVADAVLELTTDDLDVTGVSVPLGFDL